MKKFTKAIALALSLLLCLTAPVGASAAEIKDATIDMDAKGSVTLYKYDITNAEKDGIWDSSYVSTGVYDQDVNNTLGGTNRAGDTDNESNLGNGDKSFGYAIAGVEFSYLRIADIVQFSESTADGATAAHIEVLYAIDKTKGNDFLTAIGLENGKNRYTNADQLDNTKYFYQSDVLIDALAASLTANATTVKNALETYISANGGTAMPLTNEYGMTKAENLDLGIFLFCETKLPENVTTSCNPFLLSVPMTNVTGGNSNDGGVNWLYDITLYPKNLTGIPDEMYDNTILRALEYTGYDVQWLKDNGYLYVAQYVSANINNTRPAILSDIGYADLIRMVISKVHIMKNGTVRLELKNQQIVESGNSANSI